MILCIISVTALAFYRALGKMALFLIVTFMAVGEMSFFLAHMFFELGNHLFRLWNRCLEKGYISSFNYSKIVNITIIFNQILLYVVGAALLYFTLRKVVQDYREKDYAVHRTELLFILTPGLTGLMVCTLLRITIDTVENGVPETLYDRYPSKTLSGHDLLEQGKEQLHYLGETGQQPAGAYGGDGARLFRDTGDEA